MSSFQIIKYQLYLLQLENYQLGRYFKLLFKKGLWPKGEQRKSLVWTMKASLVFSVAVVIYLLVPFFVVWMFAGRFSELGIRNYELGILLLVAYLVLLIIFFLFYSLATLLLWPFDWLVKKIIIIRAKSRIKSLSSPSPRPSLARGEGGLVIIGIAGSYGKTTMKEVLKQVLGVKFQVLATPESVNTPVGIARWILKKFDDSPLIPPPRGEREGVEIAIIEMGEHYKGDIKDICNITKPDIAIITGINESHLERMRKMETVINTIFEVVDSSKPKAVIVLNGDDKYVMEHYKEYAWPDHELAVYGQRNYELGIKNYEFNTEKLGWKIEIPPLSSPPILGGGREEEKAFVNLLGEYALADVQAAIIIAQKLGMSAEEIKKGIENIKPIEHRLQPIQSSGNVLIIDDSYNGNPAGVAEAIRVLSRFRGRRKIYLTPGLVETGSAAQEIHHQIGRQLASAADVVILIRNSVTGWIEQGIKDEGSKIKDKQQQVVWFNTAQEAHSSLSSILKPNDVILFQNDWGDQYL